MGCKGILAVAVLGLFARGASAETGDSILPPPQAGNVTPATFLDAGAFAKELKTGVDKPPPPLWCGALEIGLGGSAGNTELLKLRVGGDLKRENADNVFTASTVYGFAKQMGVTSEDKAFFNARDEILFGAESPWSIFGSLQIEYDHFRAYEFLVGLFAGVGYTFVKDEALLFKGRVGAGETEEVGSRGVPSRAITEALIGYDFDYRFTDRQKFTSAVDVYPSISHPGQYRVRAKAAYEVLLDPSSGMTLRIGVQDRWDSNPGSNFKRNDVDYFTTLLFKF